MKLNLTRILAFETIKVCVGEALKGLLGIQGYLPKY